MGGVALRSQPDSVGLVLAELLAIAVFSLRVGVFLLEFTHRIVEGVWARLRRQGLPRQQQRLGGNGNFIVPNGVHPLPVLFICKFKKVFFFN